jgi:hypothetical protein
LAGGGELVFDALDRRLMMLFLKLAVIFLALDFGIVSLAIFASLYHMLVSQEGEYERLESEIVPAQMKRCDDIEALLWKIRGTSEDEREPLWAKLKELERYDTELTADECRRLADVSGALSDDAYAMIHGGK